MFKKQIALLITFLFVANATLYSQSAYVAMNADTYHLLERLELKNGSLSNDFHTDIKPFQRKHIIDFLSKFDTTSYLKLSPIDRWNMDYLRTDSWEFVDSVNQGLSLSKKPFLKHLYKRKGDTYYYQNNEFDIHASPIFHFGGGTSRTDAEDDRSQFINTRGVEIRGSIGKKFGFYTNFTENQASTAAYVRDYSFAANSFAYHGLTKISSDDSVKAQLDYIGAEGYLVFQPNKHFVFRFGNSRNFVGSGIRSFILSDFTAPYLHLAAEVRLGRLHYTNIFASLADTQVKRPVDNTVTVPSKYMALHHLNVNITKNLNVGVFEKVLFGRDNGIFDINYLNPLILYRFVEGYLGSSDNTLVGADFKLNLFKSVSIYGQHVIDEFNSKEFQREGWWGKKNATQIGAKYIDVLNIQQLDFQVEFNTARPYTFTHYNSTSNDVHYGMPLGHQLGANFNEVLARVRYQPIPRLNLVGTYVFYKKGFDTDSVNYGGNIQLNNRIGRPSDYDNFIGQGQKRTTHFAQVRATYMLKHNLFLETSYLQRQVSASNFETQNESVFSFAVRLNIGREEYSF